MNQLDLTQYIGDLYHACQENFVLHQIKACTSKEVVVARFLQDYQTKRWVPTVEYSTLKDE